MHLINVYSPPAPRRPPASGDAERRHAALLLVHLCVSLVRYFEPHLHRTAPPQRHPAKDNLLFYPILLAGSNVTPALRSQL